LKQLDELPFASQIKVFFTGFGMWQENVETLASAISRYSP
jgi:hypothetical protein